MIEAYFAQIESILRDFPNIRSYTLTKKVYNLKQGYISATIVFENGCRLEFVEVKDTELAGKVKYRYQYMDGKHELMFRYDNAPHHKEIGTFFPKNWMDFPPPKRNINFINRLRSFNYTSATAALGFMTLVAIWVP